MEIAKQYTRIKRALSIASFLISTMFLGVLLFSHFSTMIRNWMAAQTKQPSLLVLGYLLILILLNEILHLPLSYVSGYIVEHRFQLSTQSRAGWWTDRAKAFSLSLLLGIAAGELVYWMLRRYPDSWWWICALIFVLFVVAMAQLAPVLLFPLFYRFEPLQQESLKNRLLALCDRVHTRVRGVYTWKLSEKSTKANAAVVGLGPTRRIILSDTLLADFSEDEIEVVLAHELGHHVHNDTWKNILLQTVFTFVVFYLIHLFLARGVAAFGFESISDVANLPLLMAISTIFSLVVLPLVNGFSRRAERAADRFALEMTRKAAAFITSMEKLGAKNLSERQPNRWIELIFHSHPSIARRIAAAQAWLKSSNRHAISNASSPLG